jgi:cytochrome b subunit of formate dehydrogenase
MAAATAMGNSLIWITVIAGLAFVLGHALYMRFRAKPRYSSGVVSTSDIAAIPQRISRHSLLARIFHWVMAVAMFTLLFTAFLPKVGVRFPWVTFHWLAGTVLTVSVAFHVIHASFWLDFRSIWPDKIDLQDAVKGLAQCFGMPATPPRRSAKYPLANKLFHIAVMAFGLSVIGTGVVMLSRLGIIFFPRNPYRFTATTWDGLYFLHGLAGVVFIALVILHVYFGIRPEKRPLTKSMIFGWMSRDFYLKEHDPARWMVAPVPSIHERGDDTG